MYARVTHGYVGFSAILIRKSAISLTFLLLRGAGRGLVWKKAARRLSAEEDQGYIYVVATLPYAASSRNGPATPRGSARRS